MERPRLSGVVRSQAGEPVFDALIVATRDADQRESLTSARGEFRLNGLSEGTWSITAQSLFSGSAAQAVIEVEGRRTQLDMVLNYAATACGELNDTAGTPLPGRWVKLRSEQDFSSCVTDDDGSFCCRGLKGGEYAVSVLESPHSAEPVHLQDPPVVALDDGEHRTGLRLRTAR